MQCGIVLTTKHTNKIRFLLGPAQNGYKTISSTNFLAKVIRKVIFCRHWKYTSYKMPTKKKVIILILYS